MLKRTISIILLFIIVSIASIFGFTNTSFRNASTATLFEDDYDMWLGPYPLPDPARLSLIDGARLYTNLSNLVDKSEEPFSNFTNNYFLFGGSTRPIRDIANLGVIIDRYNNKEAWDTGLLDRLGNPIFGYGDVVNATLVDEDNNGTYDRRTTVEETRETWSDNGVKDFVLGFGKDMDGKSFGIFYRLSQTNSEIYGLNGGVPVNYTFDSTDVNLISGDRTFIDNKVGTGSTNDGLTGQLFGFSYWKNLSEQKTFGLHFGYTMFAGATDDVWDRSDNWNGSPDDPNITDTYSMTETSDENIPYAGNTITGWFSFINNLNAIMHLRFDTYYIRSSFDISSDATRTHTFTDNRIAADNHTESNNNSETGNISGNGSSQTVAVKGKIIYDLSKKLRFGIGLGFDAITKDTTRVESTDGTDVYTFNDGDNEPNDPDDYTQTTTYSQSIQTKTTEAIKTITIPVGLEFNITNPLVFRLGAIHSISLNEATTNEDLLSYSAELTHTVYGDGTESYQINPNPNIENIGSSEDNTISFSNTTYTYGFGYTVGQNLQIDLMGFSDLTNLSNWKVSATLKF